MAQVVKIPPANTEDSRETGSIPGREDALEEGMATHSSILAWEIPWTEEPEGLQATGSQRESYTTEQLNRRDAAARSFCHCSFVPLFFKAPS